MPDPSSGLFPSPNLYPGTVTPSTVPYCLPSDVRDVLAPDGALSEGQGTAASLSDRELSLAISDAQAQIDTALASATALYPVPFTAGVPPLVVGLTRDIAAYLATLTWMKGSSSAVAADKPVALRYQRATTLLGQLADDTLVLPGFGASPDQVGSVVNVVPDVWTWWPDIGFGMGQTIPG